MRTLPGLSPSPSPSPSPPPRRLPPPTIRPVAPAPPRAPARPSWPPAPPCPTVVPPALAGPVTYTCGAAKKGETALTPATLFTDKSAGWDLKTVPTVANGICSAPAISPSSSPSPCLPATTASPWQLGGKDASTITVRAEARRLYIQTLPVAAGKTVTRIIDVNVRIPEFTKPDGTQGRVRLKQREIGNLDWDPKLTLEFNGVNPAFHSLTIEPLVGAKAEPTLYLAGDSTMVDQDVEPWASWGQQLPALLPARRRHRQSTPSPASPPAPSSASSASPRSCRSSSPATTSSCSSRTTTRRSPTACPAISKS